MIVRFSLASLIVAMAILAVLVLALLPLAVSTNGSMAVERGGEELARELEAVRQLAVTSGNTYKVLFDRTGRAYLIMRGDDAFAPARRVELPPGVDWEKLSTNPIYFYGSGRCPVGGTVSLKCRGSGYKVEVVVATHSGRVRVERVKP